MGKRCCGLCGQSKDKNSNSKKVSMLEREMIAEREEQKKLERTKKILREDIYQNLTKRFFQLG